VLYKTGDLARWLSNGEIEFLGRIDHQVKIKGYRIELGEIENRLLKHDKIKEAVVTAEKKKTGTGVLSLSAYIVAHNNKAFSSSQLREYLLRELQDYMIPSSFIQIDSLPLTPNGKVDRKALALYGTPLESATPYTPPQTDMEKKILEVWKEILQVDKMGIHDNYFELGGNSFDIIRINKRIKEIFQMDIPIVTMFRFTTVYSLANYFIHETKEIRDREDALKRGKRDKIQRLRKRKGIR
jgi:acyl carrier protein